MSNEKEQVNGYIKFNNKEIDDIIKENIEEQLKINGDFDPANIINNKLTDISLFTIYDKDNKPLYADAEGVRKGKEYWDNELKNYIKLLEERANEDVSKLDKEQLKERIVQHNKDFIYIYMAGIKNNSLDLADKSVRLGYAKKLADSLTDLQIQEIKNKTNFLDFLNLNLEDYFNFINSDSITFYTNKQTYIDIQNHIKEVFNKLALNNVGENEVNKEQLAESIFRQDFAKKIFLEQEQRVDRIYQDNKKYYDAKHRKHNKVSLLLVKISNKYKIQNNYLNQPRYRALDNEDVLNEMQQQNKNIDNLSLTTTLVNTKIFDDFTFKSGEMVNVPINYTDKNAKTQQTDKIYITLTDKDNKDITLTPKHKVINDRIGTLIDYGYNKITARKLYNFINKGEISNDYVEPAKLEELKNDLNNMAVMGELDASEQFNNAIYKSRLDEYNKKTNNKGSAILHQQILNFKYLEYKLAKGEDVMYYYVFLDYPLFYQYAKQIKQIAVVPAEIYNINDIPSKYKKLNKAFKYKAQITDITSVIRDNLINDIELRKSKRNSNININNFFEECKFKDVDKRARETRLKAIETILNNWILKDYIKGYSIISNGRVKKYSIAIYITAEELAQAKKDKKIEVIDIKTFI